MKVNSLSRSLLFCCISPAIAFVPRALPMLARTLVTKSQSLLMSSAEEKKDTGHMSTGSGPKLSAEEEKMLVAFREHQSKAARLSMAEEVRTLIEQSIGFGVLSTNSDQYSGYPTGSVVGFALQEGNGLPYFVFSTMSAHTKDVLKDGKVSLTVMARDFQGAAEGRVVLIGDCKKVFDKDVVAKLREKYLARHKDAYWIDFGDFSYFAMTSLQAVRFVGGFAMAGSVTPEQYETAAPDPIVAFAAPVMKHMNDGKHAPTVFPLLAPLPNPFLPVRRPFCSCRADHSDSTVAMVKHYVGIPCSEAQIVSLDRLGMMVKAKLEVAGGGYSKIRLPFPRPADDRKAIKEILVEMTNASA